MLRPLITFVVALVALLAAFFAVVVWRAQPNAPTTQTASVNQAPMPVTPTNSIIGNGTRMSWQKWTNGRLESEFSAADYTPNKDGSFEVTQPVDIFYMSDGQCLKVTGDSGHLNCETPAQTSLSGMTSTNMSPRNGFLQNVRIELYKDASFSRPTLWMKTNNIHFDNDTLRIYTESYNDPVTNQPVSADQVPVTIRGDEYEFDGKGLTVIWNSKTGRLQKLLVNHGNRLEIKNPTKITLPGMAPAQPAKVAANNGGIGTIALSPATGTPGEDRFNQRYSPLPEYQEGEPEMLASVDPADVKLAINPKPATPEAPTLYRAVFNDNVTISDEVRQLASADVMMVDFLQGSNPSKNEQPTTPPSPVVPVQVAPPVAPATVTAPAPATATPATKPTTKPINGPITIRWTGRLLVTPLESEPMMPIKPGQSVVRLQGDRVHLTPEGSEIWATTATYRSPDGAVQLDSSLATPVQMTRTGGMTLDTRAIDFDPDSSFATLHGVSHLSVPVGKDKMNVAWTQLGKLHMTKQPGQSQPSGIDHVDLTGNVDVQHPQFTLNSRDLQLELAPEADKSTGNSEQLKQMTAIDEVHCKLHKNEGIDSDQLVIKTQAHSKQTVIREVIADGNVNAFDPDQTIQAGHLDAFLTPKPTTAPATKPANPADADSATAVDLESLDASDHVHAHLKNNATADADLLQIRGSGGDQVVMLSGAESATLADGKGASLAGRDIQLQPATSGVKVNGPGTLKTPRRAPATQPTSVPPTEAQPAKPIIVTWTDSLNMLGNDVDVVGQVHVQNTDVNGTFSDITGDTAHLDLMDSPKELKKPTNSASTATTAAAPSESAMGGKQLKKLTLTGHIVGNSDLNAPDGSVLRQGRLHCDQLIYTADNGQATIPGPGRMFVENHLADKTDPTGGKGAMAISWQKQMVYNQTGHTITFTGNTIVGFQQDPNNTKPANTGANAQPAGQSKMNLTADQLVITLTSAPAPGQKPTPAPQQKMQVSKMQAIGNVRVIAGGTDMTCTSADYDPKTLILTASGDAGQDVQVTAGSTTGSFSQVQYNSALQEIIKTTGSHIKSSN